MRKKAFKLILINGKRWFQRSYGNTYHSVTITIKHHANKPDVYLKSGIHYGYGNQFEQTACDMLIKEGYFTDWTEFCATLRNNKKMFSSYSDVQREKDLK